MANTDPLNDHWRRLVKRGHEIDVSQTCEDLIHDEVWGSGEPKVQRFTTRASGALPPDYELTVRKVVYHILWKGTGRGYGLHSVYEVDAYAEEHERLNKVTPARSHRGRRRKRTPKGGRRRARA